MCSTQRSPSAFRCGFLERAALIGPHTPQQPTVWTPAGHGSCDMLRSMGWSARIALVGCAALSSGCVERLIYEGGICGDGRLVPGDVCLSGKDDAKSYGTPGLTPISIRGEDFTGDDAVDLLVMGSDASGVVAGRTLAGDAEGSFGEPTDAMVFGCSAHPVPGRVDQEAPVDLLVDDCAESVSLFLGAPSGTFSGPLSVFTGALTRSSGLLDLDRDGINEVLVLGTDASEQVVLTVSFPFEGQAPDTTVVGNFDGAPFNPTGFGVLDIESEPRVVLIDPTIPGGLALMEDPLTGSRIERLDIDVTPRGVAIADVDRDGEDELLVLGLEPGALLTFEIGAVGDPTIEIGRTTASLEPLARQITDVDGDEIPDMIVSAADSTDLSFWLGLGDGTFADPIRVDVGLVPEQFFLSDLNGDDAPDLVAAELTSARLIAILADP